MKHFRKSQLIFIYKLKLDNNKIKNMHAKKWILISFKIKREREWIKKISLASPQLKIKSGSMHVCKIIFVSYNTILIYPVLSFGFGYFHKLQ